MKRGCTCALAITAVAFWILTACTSQTGPDPGQSAPETGDDVIDISARDHDDTDIDLRVVKTDTILIEGMEEEHEFHLYLDPSLGFSTYVIDDLSAEAVNSKDGTAFRAVARFAGQRAGSSCARGGSDANRQGQRR